MASFSLSAVLDAYLAHLSPVTVSKLRQLRDNPIAIAEGASGAARVAQHTLSGSATASSLLAFTGLGGYQGVNITFHLYNSGGTPRTPTIALSDDGVTYGAATNLPTLPANGAYTATLTIDFATGDYRVAYGGADGVGHATGTIAGGGASVAAFRFATTSDMTMSAIGYGTGGEAAS